MSDRDEKGRLLPGHSIKGGRPSKKVEERAFDILATKMTDEKLGALFDVLIGNALDGQYRSIELLTAYLMGKPLQRVEHTGDNPIAEKFEEWKRARLEAIREYMAQQQAAPVVVTVDAVGEIS